MVAARSRWTTWSLRAGGSDDTGNLQLPCVKCRRAPNELTPPCSEPVTLPTRQELIEHCKELADRVTYLLEQGKLYDENGVYTFPDGESFERPGG